MNDIICSDSADRITVIITGESKAYFERKVEMRKSDYEKYLSLIESDSMSGCELEQEIADIACKYGNLNRPGFIGIKNLKVMHVSSKGKQVYQRRL